MDSTNETTSERSNILWYFEILVNMFDLSEVGKYLYVVIATNI